MNIRYPLDSKRSPPIRFIFDSKQPAKIEEVSDPEAYKIPFFTLPLIFFFFFKYPLSGSPLHTAGLLVY